MAIEGILQNVEVVESLEEDLRIVVKTPHGVLCFCKREWLPEERKAREYNPEILKKNIGKRIEITFEDDVETTRREYLIDLGWYLYRKKRQGKNQGVKPIPRSYRKIKSIKYLDELTETL